MAEKTGNGTRNLLTHLFNLHYLFRSHMIQIFQCSEIFCEQFRGILSDVQDPKGIEKPGKSRLLAFFNCVDQVLSRLVCESRQLEQVFFSKFEEVRKVADH